MKDIFEVNVLVLRTNSVDETISEISDVIFLEVE